MKTFYRVKPNETIKIYLCGLAVVAVFAYFFYRSPLALPVLIPLVFLYRKSAMVSLMYAKQDEMRRQFKELIEIVAGNLRAGYAVENAFLEAGKELARMYAADSPIMMMLVFVRKGLENNVPLDTRLKEVGKGSGVAEIIEFADVFGVAKHSGGNMIDSIGQFANMIGDKIETEKEIQVTISARKGEQKIMNIVPFAILLYLDISSPGFFASLYHNLTGIAVMSGCMCLYLLAYGLSQKMLRIEI
jgi:tight adherence protein B